jgi:hypothetical protein
VDGEGLAATWTRRALDRLCFELDPASPRRLQVEESEGPSGAAWRCALPAPDGIRTTRHLTLDAA